MTLLSVSNLSKAYGKVKAVDDVSFTLNKGETLGLVGESGSGKSTIGRLVLRLIEQDSGQIIFDNQNITALNEKQLLPFRAKAQIIFQDPYASLNPRLTVSSIIGEAIDTHFKLAKHEKITRIEELLTLVGLDAAHKTRYPHEFSGGQRQRIAIARALAVKPSFIVADEAVSALDVSVQAQILNLLVELREKLGLAMLFISHDLDVIELMCDNIIVLNKGKIIESNTREALFKAPQNEYTRALIQASPKV